MNLNLEMNGSNPSYSTLFKQYFNKVLVVIFFEFEFPGYYIFVLHHTAYGNIKLG